MARAYAIKYLKIMLSFRFFYGFEGAKWERMGKTILVFGTSQFVQTAASFNSQVSYLV